MFKLFLKYNALSNVFNMNVLNRYCCTKIMITDQGKEFINNVNDALLNRLGTEHRVSTAYHPPTNGLVERYNQILK